MRGAASQPYIRWHCTRTWNEGARHWRNLRSRASSLVFALYAGPGNCHEERSKAARRDGCMETARSAGFRMARQGYGAFSIGHAPGRCSLFLHCRSGIAPCETRFSGRTSRHFWRSTRSNTIRAASGAQRIRSGPARRTASSTKRIRPQNCVRNSRLHPGLLSDSPFGRTYKSPVPSCCPTKNCAQPWPAAIA